MPNGKDYDQYQDEIQTKQKENLAKINAINSTGIEAAVEDIKLFADEINEGKVEV